MREVLLVGLGGSLGAIARFGLGTWLRAWVPGAFPSATLVINFLGSLAIGVVFSRCRHLPAFPSIALFAVTGFLGAFTTFSAFSFETVELLKHEAWGLAALYVFASVALCLMGVLLGDYGSGYVLRFR